MNELTLKIDKCIDGLTTLILNEKNAKKISKYCKLRRELSELKTEFEKNKPQNN